MRNRIIQAIIIVLFITLTAIVLATTSSHNSSARHVTNVAPKTTTVHAASPVTTTSTMTSTTSTTLPPAPTTTTAPLPSAAPVVSNLTAPVGVDPTLYAEWTRVAVCEEGGWIGSSGSLYPDSLGINATNWYANGGGSDESPAAQIAVGMRVLSGAPIPDQSGCAPW